MSQVSIILAVLKDAYPEWVVSHYFVGKETPYGFLGPTGRRRCQELAQDLRIERRDGKHLGKIGKEATYTYYRWIQHSIPMQPMVTIQPKLMEVRTK